MKKVFFAFMAFAVSLAMLQFGASAAMADKAGDFEYELRGGSAVITAYSGPGGDLEIPGTLGGYPVAGIAYEAFIGAGITSVTVPDGVTFLENEAFIGCESLVSVELPATLAVIQHYAFYTCTSLKSVVIPENVAEIGTMAFGDCASLVSVTFLGDAPKMGQDVFDGTSPGFTVYYQQGRSGFGDPWNGYPARVAAGTVTQAPADTPAPTQKPAPTPDMTVAPQPGPDGGLPTSTLVIIVAAAAVLAAGIVAAALLLTRKGRRSAAAAPDAAAAPRQAQTHRFCTSCGAKMSADAKFCPGCGKGV